MTSETPFTKIAGVRFAKYHGHGNDFIVVNGLAGVPPLSDELAVRLCDRHRGVGADGVLVALPARGVEARMRLVNADGSESAQSGNGLRCLARFLYDEGVVPPARTEIALAAGEGRYVLRRRSASRYAARMGRAVFAHPELPEAAVGGEVDLEAAGRRFRASCVHLGNPHAVLFGIDEPHTTAERYGAALERHPDFIARANVSFVRARPGGFEAVVWERGAGITLACGSGACAVAAAAVQRGSWRAGERLEVAQPGGVLAVTVDPDGEIELEGEAERVFVGEVPAP